MSPFKPLILFSLATPLAACANPGSPSPAMPGADTPQSIPAAFVVSTNEPFWQARVQGNAVSLSGPDRKRNFTVVSNEAVFDGRIVTARDDIGTLELRVTVRLCMDSMSGKSFAYTGRLSLDSGPAVEGCGDPLVDHP